MKRIYLLKFLMKASLLVSVTLFVFLIVQTSVIPTTDQNNSNAEENIRKAMEHVHIGEVSDDEEDFKAVAVALGAENRSKNGKVSMLRNNHGEPELTLGEIARMREKQNENQENRDFWSSLVKRFWVLTKAKDAEIEESNFTDYFLNSSGFSLWGTTAETKDVDRQTSFVDRDRIIPQLILALEGHQNNAFRDAKVKKILLQDSLHWWNYNGDFSKDCPGWGSKCEFGQDRSIEYDAVIAARDAFHTSNIRVSDSVLRFYFILESPFASNAKLTRTNDLLSSYWRESDLVTPYEKWVYYDPDIRTVRQEVNYAEGKKKMAAVFLSNCMAANGRLPFIRNLKEFIDVDIYGKCGDHQCPRGGDNTCFEMLNSDYKFYLSFENSNCRDYITEKFFVNALRNNVVPVVFGARFDDYAAAAPENSFIHVENYTSVKELGNYLKHLASNDAEYNQYFQWKGTGEFIATKYFCRVCAMVHYADLVPPPKRSKKNPILWHSSNNLLCLKRDQMYWWR